MLEKLKENWQQFKNAKIGHRFQDRYEQRQRESHGNFNVGRLFNIVAGIAIAAAGIFLIPAPGPGSLIIFVGLGLIGSEFLPLARALDWAEVRLRAIADWAKAVWKRSPIPIKLLISLLLLTCAIGVAFAAYQLFFGGSRGSR